MEYGASRESSLLLEGVVVLVAGIAVIVFRRAFTASALGFQRRVWGFRFSKEMVEQATIIAGGLGVVAIVFGLVMVLVSLLQ
ncbi:MAG TPA: hypothetical protein VGW38_00840 [Chloroflexota bacterium]|nr:hypothetical protein [Chloroflexota bacterium]